MNCWLLLLTLYVSSVGATYDFLTGNISLYLSAATYCSTYDYSLIKFGSYANGFRILNTIDDKTTDTQGFVGVMDKYKQIYVGYRGSTSIQDWENDLDRIKTTYNNKNCNCEVHAGMYKAYSKSKDLVFSFIKQVNNLYPTYDIIVTGHSLGAAIATFLCLELSENGKRCRMFNFGSPRLGDDNFAKYASNLISEYSRVTHHKDIVPHCPMHYFFTHISGEYYLEKTVLKECNGYEDPSCSYQWDITSTTDHECYFDFVMNCDGVSGTKTCVSS